MPTGDGIQAAHVVGWVVTAIAFAGNLLWNFLNRRHTNKLTFKISTDAYQREIWDRHRSRIESRLEDLTSLVSEVPVKVASLEHQGDQPISLSVHALNLNAAHDKLARALADTDSSSYCHGVGWATKGYGLINGSETSWDLLLAAIQEAEACDSRSKQLVILKGIITYANEIEFEVRREIRENEFSYQPRQHS